MAGTSPPKDVEKNVGAARHPINGGISWIGEPLGSGESGRVLFAGFEHDGLRYELGDHVYLTPAEPGIPPYIAKLDSLTQETDGMGWATVRWYYRPAELEVDSELTFDDGEVFYTDEFATHPLDSVQGRCRVRTPAQKEREAQAGEGGEGDAYVCSRKYLPQERRVVPLDDPLSGVTMQQALQEKPFTMVAGQVVPNPSSKRPRPSPPPPSGTIGGSAGSAESQGPADPTPPPGLQTASKRRRKERREGRSAAGVPTQEGGGGVLPAAAAAAGPPGPGSTPSLKVTIPRSAGLAATLASPAAPQGGGTPRGSRRTSTPRASDQPPGSADTVSAGVNEEGGGTPRSGRSHRESYGRWSRDRYENAQRSLVGILKSLQATSADRAILRPTLREAARKLIGDTGLLDHLLKHMTDRVVSPDGDRLRRRHNKEGHMEYWMQSPAAAEAEEEMLREEMEALTSELREVKQARHLLHAVREEAHQAIHAVSAVKDRPLSEEAAQKLPALPPPGSPVGGLLTPSMSGASPGTGAGAGAATLAAADLAPRLEGLEAQAVRLANHLSAARSLTVAGLEEVRRESAGMAALMGSNVAALAELLRGLIRRCASLEFQLAAVCEEGRGRYEALADLVLQLGEVRGMVSHRDDRIRSLESEVARLGAAIAGPAGPRSAGQQPPTPLVADAAAQQAQRGSRHPTPEAKQAQHDGWATTSPTQPPEQPGTGDELGDSPRAVQREGSAQQAQQAQQQAGTAQHESSAVEGMPGADRAQERKKHPHLQEQSPGRPPERARLESQLPAQQEGTAGETDATLAAPADAANRGAEEKVFPPSHALPQPQGEGGRGRQLPGSFTDFLLSTPVEGGQWKGVLGGEGSADQFPFSALSQDLTQGKQAQQTQQVLPPRHPTPPTSSRGLTSSGSLKAQHAQHAKEGTAGHRKVPPQGNPVVLQQAQKAQHMLPPGITPQQAQQLLGRAGVVPGGSPLMLSPQGFGPGAGMFPPGFMQHGMFQDPPPPGHVVFLHPGMSHPPVMIAGGAAGPPLPASLAPLPTSITPGPPSIKLEQPPPQKVELGRGGVAVQGRGTPNPCMQGPSRATRSSPLNHGPPLEGQQLIFDPPAHEASVAEVDMAHACNEIKARGVASNAAGFGGEAATAGGDGGRV